MLKLMLDFVRYYLTSKNHLISRAFKFVCFSFGGRRGAFGGPEPPTGAAPLPPPSRPST